MGSGRPLLLAASKKPIPIEPIGFSFQTFLLLGVNLQLRIDMTDTTASFGGKVGHDLFKYEIYIVWLNPLDEKLDFRLACGNRIYSGHV
ncbi:uncharacterized protein LOC119647935 isoform X2 [Hermetia illucens]|nr:uncharacterized protein LOC119647935 isoform X2 [Hermetia illucens]